MNEEKENSGRRAFSPRRTAAITAITFTGLIRQKAFYVILIFALILIGNSIFMARLSFQQEFQMLKDVSLGAISIVTSLLAIVATARLLPQDIEDRTIYTILAKAVPRFEYLAGKLAGVLLLLAISTLVMSAMFFAVLFLREQTLRKNIMTTNALPNILKKPRSSRTHAVTARDSPPTNFLLVKDANARHTTTCTSFITWAKMSGFRH